MAWYRTGTVAVTNGSATVTGTSTQWVSAAKTGDAIHLPDGRIYEILTINSNTSITLATNYLGTTASGQGYAIQPTRGVVQNVYDLLVSYMSSLSAQQDGPLSGRFGDGTASAPGITFLSDQDTGLYRPSANQLAAVTSGVMRWLLTTTGFTLNLPMTGTAVTQNDKDTTAGRLHRTDDNILFHALRRFGGYYPAGGSANIDTAVAGDAGLYDATLAGTFPAASGFWWITSQAIYSGTALLQRAIRYTGVGTPPATADEYMRIRANDGTWGAWRRVYNSGSVVGPVSQSGGVPTGALIERGSNANGEYVRFADGTQICTAQRIDTTGLTVAEGPFYISPNDLTWTFPASFVAGPSVNIMGSRSDRFGGAFLRGASSTTGQGFRLFSTVALSASVNLPHSCIAIGRWF
ncbi:hypothetical protein IQ03_02461 [Gemmobacter caeni]|uniref:Uncharacterized protein n=1 Tax=Gemmobacter caeni TaxID=589035 RepID=A0A2T6AZ24_9RHOB|nr:hypothetical protein [Gemmobacter caeni]PTX49064.1 hypothetical protein C8N34_108174 [Gemmobacter caeni]TWI98935.1 hypothetical protein IQ03_02461 [Gemmobacter caeni]